MLNALKSFTDRLNRSKFTAAAAAAAVVPKVRKSPVPETDSSRWMEETNL